MADKYDAFLDADEKVDRNLKYDTFLDAEDTAPPTPLTPKEAATPSVMLAQDAPEKSLRSLNPMFGAALEVVDRAKRGEILTAEEENFVRSFLKGAASGPLMGVVQLGAEAIGAEDVAKKIGQTRQEGSIVGSLFQPEAWLTGGSLAKLPGLTKQMLGMGTAGAGYGFLSPNESLAKRVEEGASAGAVSSAIPVVGRAAKALSPTAKSLLDSIMAVFSRTGRTSVGHRMVLDQLLPAERDEVLALLSQRGVDISDLGSSLTAAQALGKARVGAQVQSPAGARLAALEAELAKQPGAEALNKIYAMQEAERRGMLDTLSGGRGGPGAPLQGLSADDIALAQAKATRKETGQAMYPRGTVSGDPRLNEILDRPGVRSAMGIEEASAGNVPRVTQLGKDVPARTEYTSVFTDWQQTPYKEELPAVFAKYSIKSLQNQYRLMDKEISRLLKTGVSMDETRAYELMSAKKDLGSWLAEKSPEWAQANRFFGFQSKPVTQMEVGAELKRKMGQSPGVFLSATENVPAQEQLIRSVTGRPGQKLSDVFNLGQMSKISGLRNEAQIAQEVDKLEKMARANLGDEKVAQLPNLLNVWVAIANRMARTIGKNTVDDVTRAAADILSDPNKTRMLLAKDAANRASSMRPLSARTLGMLEPPAFVSGGMLEAD